MAVNKLKQGWLGGVPFISMRKSYNPASGKMDTLEMTIELNGVNSAEVRNLQVHAILDY